MRKFTGKTPDANRVGSILCEPVQTKCTWTCHTSHFVRKFKGQMPNANPGLAFCASLRGRNVKFLRRILGGKRRMLSMGQAIGASVRSRNAHGHVTRSRRCGNLQG